MKHFWIGLTIFSFLSPEALTLIASNQGSQDVKAAQAAIQEGYFCPPCGCDGDEKARSEPGACTYCGMKLLTKSELTKPRPQEVKSLIGGSAPIVVGILIFEGVQIIDYTGPFEVFGQGRFEVFTIAAKSEPLETNMGMLVTPAFSFENSPKVDVLVIPGGNVGSILDSPAAIDWVRKTAESSTHVLSVCNGAFILGQAGLLDGLTATTYYGLLDGLQSLAPKAKVVRNQRFTDNGKIVTTAGLSSGIDGALHLVSKIRGHASAQQVALNMEYNWKPDSGYARAAFADRMLAGSLVSGRFLPLMDGADSAWELLSTQGNADQWELRWRVKTEKSAEALLDLFNQNLIDHQWQREAPETMAKSGKQSNWLFEDGAGKPWRGQLSAHPKTGAANELEVSLQIVRGKSFSSL